MKIVELELTGVAFVSTRLMIVARDTFVAYIVNRELAPDNIAEPVKDPEKSPNAVADPLKDPVVLPVIAP
jgi:hypothetical protein